jgi:hypothetical protein
VSLKFSSSTGPFAVHLCGLDLADFAIKSNMDFEELTVLTGQPFGMSVAQPGASDNVETFFSQRFSHGCRIDCRVVFIVSMSMMAGSVTVRTAMIRPVVSRAAWTCMVGLRRQYIGALTNRYALNADLRRFLFTFNDHVVARFQGYMACAMGREVGEDDGVCRLDGETVGEHMFDAAADRCFSNVMHGISFSAERGLAWAELYLDMSPADFKA